MIGDQPAPDLKLLLIFGPLLPFRTSDQHLEVLFCTFSVVCSILFVGEFVVGGLIQMGGGVQGESLLPYHTRKDTYDTYNEGYIPSLKFF